MSFRAMSDVEGRIKKILFTHTLEVGSPPQKEIEERYSNLISQLGRYCHPDLEFHFFIRAVYALGDKGPIVGDHMLKEFNEYADNFTRLAERKIKILRPMIDYTRLADDVDSLAQRGGESRKGVAKSGRPPESRWVRDSCLIQRSSMGHISLMCPIYAWTDQFTKESLPIRPRPAALSNKFLPHQVAAQTDMVVNPTQFFFEGGNILVSNGYMVVGPDIVKANFMIYGEQFVTLGAMLSAMRRDFGVDYIMIPGMNASTESYDQIESQPVTLKHLDLFLTLGGTGVDGTQTVYLGEVLEYNTSEHRLRRRQCRENQYLDSLALWFGQQEDDHLHYPYRFTVVRTPIVFHEGNLLSYNNCLMESAHGLRMAFLPSYAEGSDNHPALLAADTAALSAFNEGGYKPTLIRADFTRLMQATGGSLHCLTKVLDRSM